MTWRRDLTSPTHFLLVDDFVTSGSQLIAAAMLLREAFPESEVNGFAVIRTMSDEEVGRILEPVTGIITYEGGGYAKRQP